MTYHNDNSETRLLRVVRQQFPTSPQVKGEGKRR